MFTTKGIIQYDPPRGKMSKKVDWWCVVNIDPEITRLYRWWIIQNAPAFGETRIELKKPSWDAHISVIRGEEPRDDLKHLWKKYDGQEVVIQYTNNVRRSGDTTGWDRPDNYFFIDIECPHLKNIRKEFGFPHDWKLHMTVGRTWN